MNWFRFRGSLLKENLLSLPGMYSTVGSMSDSKARGPQFDTQSGHILLFLLLLIQGGQLSATGESMCTKYWLLPLWRSKPAQE